MDINENKSGEILVMGLAGRLDSTTSPQFEETLVGRIKGGEGKIVLDFGGLEYISSAGLRVLLKATRELKATQGQLVICSAKDYILEVFDLSGFTSVFTLAGDVDGALGTF